VTAPRPPADLAGRTPLTLTLTTGTELHRFYPAGLEPIYFDNSLSGRLNAPDGRYGVLYAAARPQGAFAETFLRTPGKTLLAPELIAAKGQALLRTLRPLTLIQLHGPGLARLGATAEVTHGGLPYDAPQAWSAALHDHPLQADGVAYTARHDDAEVCYAIFDRAATALTLEAKTEDLDNEEGFYLLAEHYGVGLAPAR